VENALAKLETTMKRTLVKIPGRALHFSKKISIFFNSNIIQKFGTIIVIKES